MCCLVWAGQGRGLGPQFGLDQDFDRRGLAMLRAEWKTSYETGHPRIDFEHRIFLELILQIESELLREAPVEIIGRRMTELFKYADFHFYSEESIMIDIGYPDFEMHHRIHISLLEELRRYILSMSIDLIRKADLIGFLVDWFSNHTTREDVKLAAFNRSRPEG
jgi:hemerythrin